MENRINILGYKSETEYQRNIINTLSGYTERVTNADGSISYKEFKTNYFLENNIWNVRFLMNIEQFKGRFDEEKYANRNIYFRFNNPNINLEMKFIIYNRFFRSEWSLISVFVNQNSLFKRISDFINKKYPYLNSILDLEMEKVNFEWIDWLEHKGIKTLSSVKDESENRYKTTIALQLNVIYFELFNLADNREEWVKDIWDIRNLEKYGVLYNVSTSNYKINFTTIRNDNLREAIKRYLKEQLSNNRKFSTGTAKYYVINLQKFINFILQLEPSWNDLRKLEREHINKYIEWLNIYTQTSPTRRKNSNPTTYKIRALTCVNRFLSDIQMKEYSIAPIKNVKMLIFSDDKPTLGKKPLDQIDFVPDYVLEQLFVKINHLKDEIIPVVWIMYKTGLRISDVLGLKQDCLVKLNGKFWIEANIEKTYIEGHRIPIDDELANVLAVLIEQTRINSNMYNNPDNYIFVRYSGKRKGRPFSGRWVQNVLNSFSRDRNITDEMGNVYHFKNHAFRHTYAIKMLNGGVDILTVQELLAHASPEMTMRYARLLDDTKRKVFDNAVKQGVFSFDESAKLKEEDNGDIPTDVLDMLWTNHKLNAIDTPYGTCLQRTNGRCSFAKQPPCLTCNGGKPCKDLCVGAFEGDVKKYEILINSTKSMIDSAKIYNRIEMAKENEELLNLYEDIYSRIVEGSIIYSRLDRLKKQGDKNDQS